MVWIEIVEPDPGLYNKEILTRKTKLIVKISSTAELWQLIGWYELSCQNTGAWLVGMKARDVVWEFIRRSRVGIPL